MDCVGFFNLQENVFFHDGSIFDAQTVKFVINRNKTFTKGPSYIWSNVETIKVLDKYKVQINLNEPVPLDLILSSQYELGCIPQSLMKF